MTREFQTFYPGIYTDREKPFLEKYIAENKSLKRRGCINVEELINGRLPSNTPGAGTVCEADEDMVLYYARKYDPENPLYNDRKYAGKTKYGDIIAYPTFATDDDTFMLPFPYQARDYMLVSGLNHCITFHNPVYIGDKLFLVNDERHFTDLTPSDGSEFRTIAIQSMGSIYNQKGEKVCSVIFRVSENLKSYADPSMAPEKIIPWISPDWGGVRPEHYYTDDDWDLIKDIWSKEKRQGAKPLYWEEVNIGDKPAWTLDGPVEASCLPTRPYGMGTGGSRTLKKEIMDPAVFATMIRDKKDGIYRLPRKEDAIPFCPSKIKPQFAIDVDEPDRGFFVNFLGRDYAIRAINNWMGEHGWLENIRWGIMPPETMAKMGYSIPVNPEATRFLDVVPFLKEKYPSTHGLRCDVAIVKSYVYNKYSRDGEFFVELTWWIETIKGEIYVEGGATVKLPSNRIK